MNNDKQLTTVDEKTVLRQSFDSGYFNGMIKMAAQLHKGGAFQKSIKSPEQAFTIIQAGYEQGIGPVEALNSFYIVNGAIRPYGPTLTKQLRKHGWKVKIGKHDGKVCEVTVSKHDEEHSYEATYEEVDALKSQALKASAKDKLYYHAISRIVRYYIPEVMSSVAAVYEPTDGEVYDNTKHYADVPDPIDVLTPDEEEKLVEQWKELIDGIESMGEYDDTFKQKIKEDAGKLNKESADGLMNYLAAHLEKVIDAVKKEEKQAGEEEPEQASIPTNQ